MTCDELEQVLGRVGRWVDGVLALGLAGLPSDHRDRGRRLVELLGRAGLRQVERSLAGVVEAEGSASPAELGRLLVALALTEESLEIERIASLPETDGGEIERADAP